MNEPSINFKLSGWKALVIILILIVIIGIRIATINNNKNDTNLIEKVKFELMTEYLPADANKLRDLYESGDMDKLSKAVQSVTTTKINIKSIKASYSIFDFSTKKKDIVVKVEYSLDDTYGSRNEGTKYYVFRHSPMFNRWKYLRNSYAFRYYLNFI